MIFKLFYCQEVVLFEKEQYLFYRVDSELSERVIALLYMQTRRYILPPHFSQALFTFLFYISPVYRYLLFMYELTSQKCLASDLFRENICKNTHCLFVYLFIFCFIDEKFKLKINIA